MSAPAAGQFGPGSSFRGVPLFAFAGCSGSLRATALFSPSAAPHRMIQLLLLLLASVLLVGGCTSSASYQRKRALEEMRRELELPVADWDAIIAQAGTHTGFVVNKAARVSNNTIYVTLVSSEGKSKTPGPTLVFVRSGEVWLENNVFNAGPATP
jgi:hypothetical protein